MNFWKALVTPYTSYIVDGFGFMTVLQINPGVVSTAVICSSFNLVHIQIVDV